MIDGFGWYCGYCRSCGFAADALTDYRRHLAVCPDRPFWRMK